MEDKLQDPLEWIHQNLEWYYGTMLVLCAAACMTGVIFGIGAVVAAAIVVAVGVIITWWAVDNLLDFEDTDWRSP